ncbi:MAG: N-acetyltransferase family protein [Calditrichaeota bacterium]|nr:MAG: N-acetyltransferase [Calditrichota bacterium]MBL1206796.1 N-acetyltransferase family protein [Calditrichota bacterium]NOG46624.1 N-acetyltransferase [Calditrichota bacterium]
MPFIRLVDENDAEDILEIYNPIVMDTAISFELKPPPPAEIKKRLKKYNHLPWLVVEDNNKVAGYAYASPFNQREAYQWSVEVSIYIHKGYKGMRYGKKLYGALLELLKLQGIINAIALIALPNPTSIAFHKSFGFHEIGVFEKVGFKFNAWHDVSWWQKRLVPETDLTGSRIKPIHDVIKKPEAIKCFGQI